MAAQNEPSQQIELAFWDSIKNSDNPADFQAYLDQYPSGSFAALANNRLKTLKTAKLAENDRTVAPAVSVDFTAVDQIVYAKNSGALYAAPDEAAPLIDTAAPETPIRAAGRSPDGAWWQLHLPNGRTAYAKAADIAEKPVTEILTADATSDQTATVSTEPAAAAPAEPPPDAAGAKNFFDLGEALFNQGDLKGARTAFDQAIAGAPKSAEAFLRRGQVALALGDIDAAGADLDQTVSLDPQMLEAHGERILVRLAQGDAAGAVKASDEIQQIDPTVWTVNAIAAYYVAGRLDDALAMAERVTRAEPAYARGWIWHALVLKAQGRDGEAFDLLDTGIAAIGNRDWPVPIIEWIQGKRQNHQLLEAAKAGGDPKTGLRQIAEMAFFLGEAAYREDDRVQAAALLAQASDAKAPDLLACAAARALLVKMARE